MIRPRSRYLARLSQASGTRATDRESGQHGAREQHDQRGPRETSSSASTRGKPRSQRRASPPPSAPVRPRRSGARSRRWSARSSASSWRGVWQGVPNRGAAGSSDGRPARAARSAGQAERPRTGGRRAAGRAGETDEVIPTSRAGRSATDGRVPTRSPPAPAATSGAGAASRPRRRRRAPRPRPARLTRRNRRLYRSTQPPSAQTQPRPVSRQWPER